MPPDNAGFAYAAYVAAAVIYIGYAASLYWRTTQARRRLRDAASGATTPPPVQ